jgi:zinc transport system ATP-binding protein
VSTDPLTSAAPVAPAGTGVPVVVTRHLALGYDDRPALTGVDLTIGAGEVVALVGPNGSGKSTLVKGLLGLIPVLDGRIELFGTPSGRFRDRHRIGYVPQRHTVGGTIPSTVQEVVASGLLAGRHWFARPRPTDRRHVQRAIESVGLGDHRRTPVGSLSGGQQRRTLIARALVGLPDLLIMDEPTAGVDAENQAHLVEVLSRVLTMGTTLIVVTHELDALLPIVRRVIRLETGAVVADGPAPRTGDV